MDLLGESEGGMGFRDLKPFNLALLANTKVENSAIPKLLGAQSIQSEIFHK